MYDDSEPSLRPALSDKKKRDNSVHRENREVRQAASAITAAISAHTLMLARYRALAGYHRDDERALVIDGCRGITSAVGRLRQNLSDLRKTLPDRLQQHSRLVDLDRALDALEAGADDVLDKIAG